MRWVKSRAGRYVGTCHPVAKLGVTWLVRHVLASLEALSSFQRCRGGLSLSPSCYEIGHFLW